MDWLVRLGGDDWSLQGLCETFQAQPHVRKDVDGRYYLSSPELSSCVDEDGAWQEAERMVSQINDVVSALDRRHQPVVAHAVVRVDDGGNRHASVRLRGIASARHRTRSSITVLTAGGVVGSPGPSRSEKLYSELQRQGNQSALGRALTAWSSRAHVWWNLYNIYEIIKQDVSGGTNDWRQLNKITPPGMTWPKFAQELERFRMTASNSDPSHAGIDARHGKRMAQSVNKPMSPAEAEKLIDRLLQNWIDTKI